MSALSSPFPAFLSADPSHVSVVFEAIRVLYNPASAQADRSHADVFLQDERREERGWGVAVALLSGPLLPDSHSGAPVPLSAISSDWLFRIQFGALLLHHKISHDFMNLPEGVPSVLLELLLTWIVEYSKGVEERGSDGRDGETRAGDGRGVEGRGAGTGSFGARAPSSRVASSIGRVLSRLCLCYAAAVVQSGESGVNIIGRVAALFPPTATQQNAAGGTDIVQANALPLLELLGALPDEAYHNRDALTERRRLELKEGFASVADHVLALLSELLSSAAQAGYMGLVEKAFRCFGAWCMYVGMPAETVAASPLIEYAFGAISSMPRLFDTSCGTLRDTIDAFYDFNRHMPVISKLLQGLLQLEPLLDEAIASYEWERCRMLAKVYTDATTAYGDATLLVLGDEPFEQCKMSLLRIMVKCSVVEDADVAMETVRFWAFLGKRFGSMSNNSTTQQLVAQFAEVALQVAAAFIAHLQFPEGFEALELDKQHEFKYQFRYDASDVLFAIGNIVRGEQISGLIVSHLEAAVETWTHTGDASHGWERTEAALYALRAIAQFVEKDDAALSHVFAVITTLPPHTELRATVFRVIARFSRYVVSDAARYHTCLQFVVQQGLQAHPYLPDAPFPIASPVQELASLALFDLATASLPDSREDLVGLASELNIVSMQYHNSVRVIEAISRAIAFRPAGGHEGPLTSLISPFVRVLNALAEDAAAACLLAASDGTLLALCVHKDGSVTPESSDLLHVPESTLTAVVRHALSNGGAVSFDTSIFAVSHVSRLLAQYNLERIAEALYHCRVPAPVQLAVALGMSPGERWPLPVSSPLHTAVHDSDRSLTDAIANIVVNLWPTLSELARTFADAHVVPRKIARLLNFSLRNARQSFLPLLPAVIDVVIALDASLQGECEFMYLARMMLTRFRESKEHVPRLLEMVQHLLHTAVCRFRDPATSIAGAAEADPYYLESVLDLAATTMSLFPDHFLYSAVAADMAAISVSAMEAQHHIEIRKGTMAYLLTLLGQGIESNSHRTPGDVLASRRARVEEVLSPVVEQLGKTSMQCILSTWPHHSLTDVENASLSEVLHRLFVHYMPPSSGQPSILATWALDVFSLPKVTREVVPLEQQHALLLAAFSDPSISLQTFTSRLTAIFDAARGFVQPVAELDDVVEDENTENWT